MESKRKGGLDSEDNKALKQLAKDINTFKNSGPTTGVYPEEAKEVFNRMKGAFTKLGKKVAGDPAKYQALKEELVSMHEYLHKYRGILAEDTAAYSEKRDFLVQRDKDVSELMAALEEQGITSQSAASPRPRSR